MVGIAQGWQVKVDRGPDWLFIHLSMDPHGSADFNELAEHLWSIVQQHFTYRVVLELDDVPVLPSYLVGQLVLLHKRIYKQNGVLRLCGLSDGNQQVLHLCRLEHCLPTYKSRDDAVRGHRPSQPR